MVPLHLDHVEIQPERPTAGADIDLVVQEGSKFVVIPVDRCILLPSCPMLAKLCSTLPADPDHVDCACFRQRVTVTGAKAAAVKALVEVMYRGIAELQQVSFEDVSIVASQLGFRGKDGLAMEPKALIQEEEDVIILEEENEAEEYVNIAEQGRSGAGLVDSTVDDLDSTLDDLDLSEEVPSNPVEFPGGMEEDSVSLSVRATSTPVKAARSLETQHGDVSLANVPILNGDNGTDKTSRLVPLMARMETSSELIDEVGNDDENLEGEVLPGTRATFSRGELKMKEGVQGGSVEASVGQEAVEDMDLDLTLMKKTKESQIDLGSVGQGPRSRSSSASRMTHLLNDSAKKRCLKKVSLHKGMPRKTLNGKGIQKVVHKKSKVSHGGAQTSEEVTDVQKCNKCVKEVSSGKGNLCRVCERVFHAKCSSGKTEGIGWVCKTCKEKTRDVKECGKCGNEVTVSKGKGNLCRVCEGVFHVKCSSHKSEGKGWVCKPCKEKSMQKQEGGVAVANKARKGTTRRNQSVSTDIGRVTPPIISRTKKGQVMQVAKDKEAFRAADQGLHGKRKVEESEATEEARPGENLEPTCTEEREAFNKVVPVKDMSSTPGDDFKSGGSERPVRSAANKKAAKYWESLVRAQKTLTKVGEKRFKCKYCKASFSAVSRLCRHEEKTHGGDDIHNVV